VIIRDSVPFGERQPEVGVEDLRTGAAAAIGAKYLAPSKISSVGLIGTGKVGRASIICLSTVREFEKVYVYSGRRSNESFAIEMSKILGKDVIATRSAEETVKNADVLVTATYATTPIVKGEWLRKGTHISGMGSDDPLKSELDAETLRRANKIVIDGEKCLTIGEIASAIRGGTISASNIYGKIGELVAGTKRGREGDNEITVFISDGTNLQSAGASLLIYKKVKELGLGVETSSLKKYFFND